MGARPAWRRAEKNAIGSGWPDDVVSIRAYGVYLGAGFVRANGLQDAKTVNLFLDDENKLMAFQFPKDGKGDFVLTGVNKNKESHSYMVGCRTEIKKMRIRHGPYRVQKEADGYFVIDTKTMLPLRKTRMKSCEA